MKQFFERRPQQSPTERLDLAEQRLETWRHQGGKRHSVRPEEGMVWVVASLAVQPNVELSSNFDLNMQLQREAMTEYAYMLADGIHYAALETEQRIPHVRVALEPGRRTVRKLLQDRKVTDMYFVGAQAFDALELSDAAKHLKSGRVDHVVFGNPEIDKPSELHRDLGSLVVTHDIHATTHVVELQHPARERRALQAVRSYGITDIEAAFQESPNVYSLDEARDIKAGRQR